VRTPHQLILPSLQCHKAKHRIESRAKLGEAGRYDYCLTCSLGYEMAMNALDDEDAADRFVQTLRLSTGREGASWN
jgi:hypothetical protein